MSADGQFGNKFVELAETAAVGRALSDAGFGLQFADREGDMDPEVTEAPFDPQMIAGAGGALPEGTYMDSALQEGAAGDGEVLQEEAFPGQYGIEEYIPMPEEVGQAMGMPPAMHQAGAAPAAAKGANAQAAGSIRKDMPVEQIYSMLNRDSAAAVVIPMGFNKGKTLGQVAVEKPANLQWYVDSYGGPDNLLRAAAKFLIDAALGQAS